MLSISNGIEKRKEPTFIQFDGNGAFSNFQRAVVYEGHKLIVDFFKDETFFELYDVEHDREETDNLIFNPSYDDKASELAALLAAHMARIHDHLGFPSFNPEAFREEHKDFIIP